MQIKRQLKDGTTKIYEYNIYDYVPRLKTKLSPEEGIKYYSELLNENVVYDKENDYFVSESGKHYSKCKGIGELKIKEYKSVLLSPEEGIKYYSSLYPNEEIRYSEEYDVFVSDQGNIFSKSKKVGKYSKRYNNSGYEIFKNTTAHKIVMKTFGKYIEGMDVDHINNDPKDNRLYNLQMLSHSDNIKKRDIHGSPTPMLGRCGKQHGRSKPVIQYDLEGNFIKEWESINLAAKALGLSQPSISACCKHRKYYISCGNYKWEYKKVEDNNND